MLCVNKDLLQEVCASLFINPLRAALFLRNTNINLCFVLLFNFKTGMLKEDETYISDLVKIISRRPAR